MSKWVGIIMVSAFALILVTGVSLSSASPKTTIPSTHGDMERITAPEPVKVSFSKADNYTFIDALAKNVSNIGTYEYGVNDCTQYSYNLCENMTALGFNVRMVTGWYAVGNERYWHRWLETENMVIDATPPQAGLKAFYIGIDSKGKYEPIITNYDRSYATEWGMCHVYG